MLTNCRIPTAWRPLSQASRKPALITGMSETPAGSMLAEDPTMTWMPRSTTHVRMALTYRPKCAARANDRSGGHRISAPRTASAVESVACWPVGHVMSESVTSAPSLELDMHAAKRRHGIQKYRSIDRIACRRIRRVYCPMRKWEPWRLRSRRGSVSWRGPWILAWELYSNAAKENWRSRMRRRGHKR